MKHCCTTIHRHKRWRIDMTDIDTIIQNDITIEIIAKDKGIGFNKSSQVR